MIVIEALKNIKNIIYIRIYQNINRSLVLSNHINLVYFH
jgi:hypothetical protein